MEIPDLTTLSLASFAALLLLIAAVDTGWHVLTAIATKTFDTQKVADFLITHVVMRVAPIFALAIFGHGIAALGVPAIAAASLAAVGGLTAYVVETVGSLIAGIQPTPAQPADGGAVPGQQTS